MTSEKRRHNVMLLAPDLGYGGAERSFAKLTHLLSKRYNIFPVVFNEEIEQTYPVSGTLISLDIKTRTSFAGKLLGIIQRTVRLRSLKRELKIEVCISFLEGADYINVLSKGKEKTILSVRGSKRHDKNISGFSGWLRKRILLPAIFKKADAVISVSSGLQEELQQDFSISPERTDTIYNYYDLASMQASAKHRVDENLETFLSMNKCLVTVGRLSPEKGFQQLLRVFALVVEKQPKLKLVFIGAGDEVPLKKICAASNLAWQSLENHKIVEGDKHVFFLGYRPEPIAIIAKCSLFILPSLTEGFPNALIEAMTAGVPVVAADCPHGPKEILEGDQVNGVLLPHFFEYDNPANLQLYMQWARAITAIVDDKVGQQALVERARQRVSAFTEEGALKKWSAWIERS